MVPGSWGFPQWRGLVGRSSGCFVELVERILCRLYVGPAGLRFGEQIVRAGRKHWEKFWIKLSAPKEGGRNGGGVIHLPLVVGLLANIQVPEAGDDDNLS